MVILTITFVLAADDIAANRNRTTFHYVLCGALSDSVHYGCALFQTVVHSVFIKTRNIV